jgi:hypothetical protein
MPLQPLGDGSDPKVVLRDCTDDHVHLRRVLCELREAVLEQVGRDRLMAEFHVYLAPDGRINVAGVHADKRRVLAKALAEVMRDENALSRRCKEPG